MNAPAPFIVGAPRSGTTLLRLMLDAHPLLAIPPETTFLPLAAALPPEAGAGDLLQLVTGFENWPDFHLQAEDLAAELHALVPFSVPAGLRAFYRLYAARFGKPRWGDKTPVYGQHLGLVQQMLPEARFVHLIRDGRDVALSVRPQWFAPTQDLGALASDWALRVRTAREQARVLLGYLEVRYEDLVREPEATLRRVCSFVELEFEAAMLRFHERAPERLAEHLDRRRPDGSIWLSREQRRLQQWRTQTPPDLSRIGRWRREMSPGEQRAFEDAAGDLLLELGYELGTRRPPREPVGGSVAQPLKGAL